LSDQCKTITVIVPTFERPSLLARALAAILASTYRALVVAVYDNASGPETERVVRSFGKVDERVRYHRHDTNIGGYANFAFGLARVETPYFAMLSDDDVPLVNFFETAMRGFESEPIAAFGAGATVEMTAGGKLVFAPQAFWPRGGRFSGIEGLALLLGGYHPSWNTMVFRTACMRNLGMPDLALQLVFDLEFTTRLAASYPFVVDLAPCGLFVRHETSSTEYADSGVARDFDAFLARVAERNDIESPLRTFILERVAILKTQRLEQVAVKQLVIGRPAVAREAIRAAVSAGARGVRPAAIELFATVEGALPLTRYAIAALTNAWQRRRTEASLRAIARGNVDYDLGGFRAALSSSSAEASIK